MGSDGMTRGGCDGAVSEGGGRHTVVITQCLFIALGFVT